MAESTKVTLSRSARLPVFVLLLLLSLTILAPLFFVFSTSLRTNQDYLESAFRLPMNPTLYNFQVLLFEYHIAQAFLNSVVVIAVCLVLQLTVASFAAFGLAKYKVRGAGLITSIFVSVMLIPGQVLLIPTYVMLSNLGLVGNYGGLIVVYVVTGLPFAIFFLSLAFRDIPTETLEAARIDGAGFLQTYWSILIPLGTSSLAALAVLQFLGMWNELLFGLMLIPDRELRLLTPTLALMGGRFLTNQPLVSSGLVVTALVPILLLTFASRYIMGGLAVGGVVNTRNLRAQK